MLKGKLAEIDKFFKDFEKMKVLVDDMQHQMKSIKASLKELDERDCCHLCSEELLDDKPKIEFK